jgi:hypothetical protein
LKRKLLPENLRMAKGKKTGGRVAGVPNRRTTEVITRLEKLGCDPIEGMARLAMDDSNAPELRGRMFAELAQYVAPKRRALDLESTSSSPVSIRIGIARRPASGIESTRE